MKKELGLAVSRDVGGWRNVVQRMGKNILADWRTFPTHFPLCVFQRNARTEATDTAHLATGWVAMHWDSRRCLPEEPRAPKAGFGSSGLNQAREEATLTASVLYSFPCVQVKLGHETVVCWEACPKPWETLAAESPLPCTHQEIITWLRATFKREKILIFFYDYNRLLFQLCLPIFIFKV